MFDYKTVSTRVFNLDKKVMYAIHFDTLQKLFLENFLQLNICKSQGWEGYGTITSPTLGIANL